MNRTTVSDSLKRAGLKESFVHESDYSFWFTKRAGLKESFVHESDYSFWFTKRAGLKESFVSLSDFSIWAVCSWLIKKYKFELEQKHNHSSELSLLDSTEQLTA